MNIDKKWAKQRWRAMQRLIAILYKLDTCKCRCQKCKDATARLYEILSSLE